MPDSSAPAPWFVYVLECTGDLLYTGVTPDVALRFEKHRSGRGAAFTRINPPLRVLAALACENRSAALKAEAALKKRRRPAKLAWVRENPWPADERT